MIRRTSGFSLILGALGVAGSALIASGVYALTASPGNAGSGLHTRVELQLEAIRAVRAVTDALAGLEAVDLEAGLFQDPYDGSRVAILESSRELILSRQDADGRVISSRLLSRNLESLAFESGDSLRVTAGFRRVADGRAFEVRKSGIVNPVPGK